LSREGDPLNVDLVRTRQLEHQKNVLNMVGQLLIPMTEGFEHVNLDMSFTYLGNSDLYRVEGISSCINLCHMWGLKQSEFLLRGELATLLNSRRSRGAKSMNLFTEVTTKTEQKFKDETIEKKGFSFFGKTFGGSKQGGD